MLLVFFLFPRGRRRHFVWSEYPFLFFFVVVAFFGVFVFVARSFSWARLLCRFRRGRRLLYRFRRELSRRRRLNLFVFVVVRVCRRFRDRCHRARCCRVCCVRLLLVVLCACSLDRPRMFLVFISVF